MDVNIETVDFRPHISAITTNRRRVLRKFYLRTPSPRAPRIIASVYVLGIGAGRNPGCLASEKAPFKLAESHCQGRKPS